MVHFADFEVTEERAVRTILDRAVQLDLTNDRLSLRMDLSAVHSHYPLRLQELSETDDGNFCHDVGGIIHYLDRKTGSFTECFHPRYAQPKRKKP